METPFHISLPVYLKSRVNPVSQILPALSLLLVLSLIDISVTRKSAYNGLPDSYFSLLIYGVGLCLITLIFRLPRWTFYISVFLILALHLYFFTQVLAKGDQDDISIRDDAVELTTQAFLRGENPWNHVPQLDVGATTGPAGILLAIPLVLAFGEINWLAFFFWILFFLILLAGDLQTRNSAFPVLALIFVIGVGGFNHTLFWSLDELYFAMLIFPLAWWSVTRQHDILTGILLALPPLFRINYAFLLMGFILWFLFKEGVQLRRLAKMALGAFVTAGIILLPFLLVGGKEFLQSNPLTMSFAFIKTSIWPANNVFFRFLNYLSRNLGSMPMQVIKLGLTTIVMLVIAGLFRKSPHPFWHLAAAGLLAHTIVWFSRPALDYQLMFIAPAFMAVAFTSIAYQAVTSDLSGTGDEDAG
jgi:hypothetical protein